MANLIIKKQDGKLALWSTVADDFIFEQVSPTQLRDYWLAQYSDELEKRISEASASGGEGLSWAECISRKKERADFYAAADEAIAPTTRESTD